MIVFPNAKINLGLNVTERRPDGYHNLETVFYPVSVEDALEVVRPPKENQETKLHLSGRALEGDPEKNIVLKAYRLLEKEYSLPPVDIYLHKYIPSGAGLGGGSADGAFMIKLLNELFHLGIDRRKCRDLALRLGADCPFFIENSPCYATGIGEILEPTNLDLSRYYVLIVKPPVFVSTHKAFQFIQPTFPEFNVRDIVSHYPVEEWHNLLKNDFEQSVFPQFPELPLIKKKLYENGAIYASMSGSGSALYGLFKEEPSGAASLFPNSFTWWNKLKK